MWAAVPAPGPGSALYPESRLNPGDELVSDNGEYTLVMQHDGDLVEYDASGVPVWSSHTNVPGSDLEAQDDGNFVIYAPGHIAVWATGTSYRNSVLALNDDGNIVVNAPGGIGAWSSNTVISPAVQPSSMRTVSLAISGAAWEARNTTAPTTFAHTRRSGAAVHGAGV